MPVGFCASPCRRLPLFVVAKGQEKGKVSAMTIPAAKDCGHHARIPPPMDNKRSPRRDLHEASIAIRYSRTSANRSGGRGQVRVGMAYVQ